MNEKPSTLCVFQRIHEGYTPLPSNGRIRMTFGPSDDHVHLWRDNTDRNTLIVRGSQPIAVQPAAGNEIKIILMDW